MTRRSLLNTTAVIAVFGVAQGWPQVPAASNETSVPSADKLASIQHIVVVYQENHSFDNLYGKWEGVNGLANADSAHTRQTSQGGVPYNCLLQNDFSLTPRARPVERAGLGGSTASRRGVMTSVDR